MFKNIYILLYMELNCNTKPCLIKEIASSVIILLGVILLLYTILYFILYYTSSCKKNLLLWINKLEKIEKRIQR